MVADIDTTLERSPTLRHPNRRRLISTLLSLSALSAALIVPTGASAATLAANTTTAQTSVACDEGRWPTRVQGKPATFISGGRAGDYLWHDAYGWHLRVTHPGAARVVFTGKIVSNTALSAKGYHLESSDSVVLSADRKTLTYRFTNYGHIDGIDFRTACATKLWVRGSMAGVRLPVGRIWLGRAGHHPLQNPFVILRTS
jgi:hypothetical protein